MFTLTIRTDNAAFEDVPRTVIAQLLRNLSRRLERDDSETTFGVVYDDNGNRCGEWGLTD